MNTAFRRSALATALLLLAGAAQAGTVIYNTGNAATAKVALGVNDDGSLNTDPNITTNASATGLAYKFPDGSWRDATAPGCLCEGWGVSATSAGSPDSGFANVDSNGGANNLTVGGLSNVSGSTVTTSTSLTSLPGLSVTHAYAPATNAPGALFQSVVTITNTTGATLSDVRYVRVMDWDVPPTEFNEFVTIKGTATSTLLERSHNDGFATADPLGAESPLDAVTEDVDFEDYLSVANGGDHGAYFRFNFGDLLDAESYSFTIFYGAAANERAALLAIGDEGIELYSLGQSSAGAGGTADNLGPTFIFGFKGVGGVPQEPDLPEPASLALFGLGLFGLHLVRRRKV